MIRAGETDILFSQLFCIHQVCFMSNQPFVFISCLVFFLLRLATPVFAIESLGLETKITAGLGIEYLKYEEQLPETNLKSNANVSNMVVRVEGVKRWENIFIGIDGVAPVVSFDSQEEWLVNGMVAQTDSLGYGIAQLATFVGYSVASLFNPYLGLRSTWSKQKRSDFREADGTLISSSRITESIKAHYISLGFRGGLSISKDWGLSYGAEYNFPYYSKVTNDGFPGWEATNINGYLWNAYSELLYVFKAKFSLGLLLSIGQQHWNGGGWKIYNGGQIKWPENDTYFINSFLNFNRSF
jgi:hypothetical protein